MYILMYIYIHTHTHTYANTCTYTYLCLCLYTYMPVSMGWSLSKSVYFCVRRACVYTRAFPCAHPIWVCVVIVWGWVQQYVSVGVGVRVGICRYPLCGWVGVGRWVWVGVCVCRCVCVCSHTTDACSLFVAALTHTHASIHATQTLTHTLSHTHSWCRGYEQGIRRIVTGIYLPHKISLLYAYAQKRHIRYQMSRIFCEMKPIFSEVGPKSSGISLMCIF